MYRLWLMSTLQNFLGHKVVTSSKPSLGAGAHCGGDAQFKCKWTLGIQSKCTAEAQYYGSTPLGWGDKKVTISMLSAVSHELPEAERSHFPYYILSHHSLNAIFKVLKL